MNASDLPAADTSAPAILPQPKSRVRGSLALLLLTLLAIAGGVYYFGAHAQAAGGSEPEGAAPAPPAPKVTVAPVEERTVTDHRELLGRVDAMETVEIRPRVSGHIEEVKLQSGQSVRKGDLLFVIDPRWYKAQFDLATAGVERAKVRVRIAERDLRRSNELLASRAISVEEADTRSSNLDAAKAELLAAEATLDTARLDLDYTQVRAPISGRVSRAYVTAGNLVSGAPGGATLLASIVSEGQVYVYADVDEASYLTINKLTREKRLATENGLVPVDMQLTDEAGYPHRGFVESADNRLDPGTGSVVLRMVFANEDGKLVPGLAARIRIPVSAAQPALMISERAIGTNQSQKFVLTVNHDNVVALKSVKLGSLINGKRVIREGLLPSDRVIVNGTQRVSAGMTVNPETAAVAMK